MVKAAPALDRPTAQAAEAFITASRALVGIAIRSINAASTDVRFPRHRVMVVLAADGPQGISQLADQLGIDQSNASRLCDRLQRLGLIARQRSSTDGRAVHVHLTSSGAKILKEVNAYRQREVGASCPPCPANGRGTVQALTDFSQAARETTEQSGPYVV